MLCSSGLTWIECCPDLLWPGPAVRVSGLSAWQGFQLVVPPSKLGAPLPVLGRAVFPQRATDEQREEYLLSIGRIFHRVLLCGSAINVTHYRPR